MKQLKIFVGACLIAVCFGTWGNSYADHVHAYVGDYTTPGVFDGELTIIGGNLDVKHSLTINADLKIISGKVIVASDNPLTTTVNLFVHGDLIVTNTETSGEIDATITVSTGRLMVTGEIFTRSTEGQASIMGRYGIQAGKIETAGKKDSIIDSPNGDIDVVGDIFTKSLADAHIKAYGNIKAAAIFTDGDGMLFDEVRSHRMFVFGVGDDGTPAETAYIEAGGSIDVGGMIVTKSKYGSAYVEAALEESGYIRADSIFTDGKTDAYVRVVSNAGYIEVLNDIVTKSYIAEADVVVDDGYLHVGNVSTEGADLANISASDYINARGDIKTTSTSGSGVVVSSGDPGTINAKSITTSAKTEAYVLSAGGIDVVEAIATESFEQGDASVKVEPGSGSIKAGSIRTKANDGIADVVSTGGNIEVKRTINTYSEQDVAEVHSIGGDVFAENIYTDAYGSAKIWASVTSDVIVEDVIRAKSRAGIAPVEALGEIVARAITIDAYSDGYIKSSNGSITVKEDISIRSETGDAYVEALNGNITAQRIRTMAPAGQDDYIQAKVGTARFMFVLNEEDSAKTLKDAEFDFDADHECDTMITFTGTCVLNGKGHQLVFGPNGGFIVANGSTLYIHNLELKNIWGTSIRCNDAAGTIHCNDVIWTQTSNYSWDVGTLEVDGSFVINGPGTRFTYASSQASTIRKNAMVAFNPLVTVDYNTGDATRLAMVDETSRCNFNGSTLYVSQDVQFTKGTLAFDNKVTFSIPTGKTVTFGDGNAANNIGLEYHVSSNLNKVGDGSIVDSNA